MRSDVRKSNRRWSCACCRARASDRLSERRRLAECTDSWHPKFRKSTETSHRKMELAAIQTKDSVSTYK